MKRVYLILIFLVVAIAIGGFIGLKMYKKAPSNTSDLKTDLTVDISKITSDFKADTSKARRKYDSKVIVLKGIVSKTETDQTGHRYIYFTANDVKIQCLMQDDNKVAAADVKDNEEVAIKGQYTGYIQDDIDPQPMLQLRDCVIQN